MMAHKLTHEHWEKQQYAEDDPKGQSATADVLGVDSPQSIGETGLKQAVDGSADEHHERSNEMNDNHVDVLRTCTRE